MKAEEIYRELKKVAERLEVTVSEQNFRSTGIKAKSGYCLVRNEQHCYIDKHLRIHRKVEVLAECIGQLPYENVFVIPAVREIIDRYVAKEKKKRRQESPQHEAIEQPVSEK
ncbi:MAG: hypothetical protein HKM93_15205 [Desulfobacteraceae bacterium]|nr:hypothetical protein [Desulfobacteraceae bacterium]